MYLIFRIVDIKDNIFYQETKKKNENGILNKDELSIKQWQTPIVTNIQTVTQIQRHRYKETHKQKDKGTDRKADTQKARKLLRNGRIKMSSFKRQEDYNVLKKSGHIFDVEALM